jgi:YD repeat-containing protein
MSSIDNTATTSATEPDWFIQAMSYNARGWLTRAYTVQGATTLLDMYYARNGRGMVTGVSNYVTGNAYDATRSWAYTYDPMGRLIFADNQNGTTEDAYYNYDDADNMLSNSKLCAGGPLTYPTQGYTSVRPHAPATICGAAVTTMRRATRCPTMSMARAPSSPAASPMTAKTAPSPSPRTATSLASPMARMASGRGRASAAMTSSISRARRSSSRTPPTLQGFSPPTSTGM